MSTKQAVNMSDVAKACGISRQVVSYILSGDERKSAHFSAETRDRVLASAADLGYRRNRTAINFTQSRQGNFDLITNSLFAGNVQLLSGIIQTAREHDQGINISIPDDEHQAVRCLYENTCDAALLLANTDEQLDQKLEKISSPLVRINCNIQDAPGCINFDEDQGMSLLVESAIKRRRQSLCFYKAGSTHVSSSQRALAVKKHCADKIKSQTIDCPQTRDEFFQHLQAHPEIDCIIIYERALPKLYDALRRLGRTPGEDLSILCVGYHIVAQAVHPMCAGIQVSLFDIGAAAVQTAIALINGKNPAPQKFPYTFHNADSL